MASNFKKNWIQGIFNMNGYNSFEGIGIRKDGFSLLRKDSYGLQENMVTTDDKQS